MIDKHKFYTSKRWRRKREAVLRRDNYVCRECSRYGKTVPADIVHHCYPLMDYPELKLKSWNLISLCNACHNKAHKRGGDPIHPVDGLTDVGERIRDLRKIKYENWLKANNSKKDNKNEREE